MAFRSEQLTGGKEQLDCIKFTVYGEPVAQGRPLK